MGYLLHLSDLHLAPGTAADHIGDGKVPVISAAQRQSRFAMMRESLAGVGRTLSERKVELDAVVITGDVTLHGGAKNFEHLPKLLDALDPDLPPERVLVVPGNHDVNGRYGPSMPKRYERFISLDAYGYLRAWLEGVDAKDDGEALGSAPPPIVVARDGSFRVVGINSANHSMIKRPVDSALMSVISKLRKEKDHASKNAVAEFDRLRSVDMARVDRAQQALGRGWLADAPPDQLRMVALHHQILPVSIGEEIKPYEAMLNLGEVRDWLALNRVDVVLHGHKHVGRLLKDSHQPEGAYTRKEWVLVSGFNLDISTSAPGAVGWLLKTSATAPRSTGIQFIKLQSQVSGEYALAKPEQIAIDAAPQSGLIEGKTAHEVHKVIMGMGAAIKEVPRPLICRFSDPADAGTLPPTYPKSAAPWGTEWFERMVSLWQKPNHGGIMKMNHGERLKAVGGVSQFDAIAAALRKKADSSRGLAVLVSASDITADEFPAFTLAQFMRRGDTLEVVAYYRKQEMPYWWPINAAELASMQRQVIMAVGDPDLVPGAITTVTAIPECGRSVPKLLVPWIDVLSTEQPRLLALTLPFFAVGPAPEAEWVSDWSMLFDDWTPGEEAPADGDPMPLRGLDDLATLFESMIAVAGASADPLAARVQELLDLMVDANNAYSSLDRTKWRNKIIGASAKIRQITEEKVAAASAPG